MIKLVFPIRRRPDVDEAEFHRYWREEHGPLVLSCKEVLRIRRYVQSHTLDTPVNAVLQASRQTGGPYDGVAELWWDSVDDLAAATASPEGQAAAARLLEDEARFIDFASASIFLTEEHEVIAADATP